MILLRDLKFCWIQIRKQFRWTIKIILLELMSNTVKNVDILASCLSVLYNYFSSTKYFSDLYPAKILDLSAKSFFLYVDNFVYN